MKDSTSYIQPKKVYGRNALFFASMFVAMTTNASQVANNMETTEGFSRFIVVHNIENISNTAYHSLTNVMIEEEDDFFDVEYTARPHYVSEPIKTTITRVSKGELLVSDDLFEEMDYID